MSKKKWDKLPLMTWKFTMYKEDEKGNKISDVRGIRAACKVMKTSLLIQ